MSCHCSRGSLSPPPHSAYRISSTLPLLRTFSVLWFALVVPLSLLLLVVAMTFQGRIFAIGAIALGTTPLLAAVFIHATFQPFIIPLLRHS
ncbi:hypothetical protein DES53_103126 [Roseimicrobium gellanilyticum]|uniref:Uncharacterized protein n=1 Tax=Roseimicrobium gellanilyticum TaxID=748857 RepID=A0A366HQJ7_9BACT|nr:hypothetical protein DES53_103126 [Roseimicrobium gellanilyticum]